MDWIKNRRSKSAGAQSGSPGDGSDLENAPSWVKAPRQLLVTPQAMTTWSERLFYVDKELVVELLSRIVASEDLRSTMQLLPEMRPITSLPPESQLPAGINTALAATCLIQATQRHIALPALSATTQIGQPAAASGEVVGLEREQTDLILRVRDTDTGVRMPIRLIDGARLGWHPVDIRGQLVLGIGLVRRIRFRQLDAAAIAFLSVRGVTPD